MKGTRWALSRFFVLLATLRRDKRPAVRMGDALHVVERVLLVLPLDETERQKVLPQIFAFKSDFPQWNLDLLFLGGEAPVTEDAFKGIGIVRASVEDITPLGLPGRDLLSRLRDHNYDMAIDLSMDIHPFVPYLLDRSQVPLKMGVNEAGRMRRRLYNLAIRLNDSGDVMNRLADTLAPICRTGTA
ncbi:hypothetical protein ACFL6T_05235 [Candidatus Zixiibacteriota bacterium]